MFKGLKCIFYHLQRKLEISVCLIIYVSEEIFSPVKLRPLQCFIVHEELQCLLSQLGVKNEMI